MAQTANKTAREIAMERRRLSYQAGKVGLQKIQSNSTTAPDRTRSDELGEVSASAPVSQPVTSTPDTTVSGMTGVGAMRMQPGKIINPARAASLERRLAMSSRGKAALSGNSVNPIQMARSSTQGASSSRAVAQAVRQQRSSKGKCDFGDGNGSCRPSGRMRPGKEYSSPAPGPAEDAYWKVGAAETSHGQTVTGTRVGRGIGVTGDDYSTCRSITGTEYESADTYREMCQTEPVQSPRKVHVTSTATGNSVSGNHFGRSATVTGNEPGTCKNITGNQYVGAGDVTDFCRTPTGVGASRLTGAGAFKDRAITGNDTGRSEKVTGGEHAVHRLSTNSSVTRSANGGRGANGGLASSGVTGGMAGRSEHVTGNEPGSSRHVTGDDLVGKQQHNPNRSSTPGRSNGAGGGSGMISNRNVSGTVTGRAQKVTGNEPGTCKAVTGTPYNGAETYQDFCDSGATSMAMARAQRRRSGPGMPMTGQQPGIGGAMTGASKGACEPLTGTPYVGADQYADACPGNPAQPGSPDLSGAAGNAPWGQFSVDGPSHASRSAREHSAVTGTQYEQGHITGAFSMATGKVTGTEEVRFGNGTGVPAPAYQPTTVESRVKARITGEGQDSGLRITGDDWDRNENVTGTEGMSAARRNPTRRGAGGAMAMQMADQKRNEDIPVPNSKVTGSSGNTEKGSLITYSGGARG